MITSSVDNTNPAGRLHDILSHAKQCGGGSAFDIWSKVFGISAASLQDRYPTQALLEAQIEVFSRVLQLKQLIDDTETSLRRIDGLADRYFRPFVRIRSMVQQSVLAMNSADLSANLTQITEGDMTVLEFCSEKLEALHVEPLVDDAELQEILLEVNTLFDEVRAADINAELKSFLLDGLEALRRGINEFRIRGPKRLKETLADVIGALAVNQDVVKAGASDESFGRFEKLCYRLAAAVSFASDSVGLLAAMKVGLLPSGG